MKSPRQAFRPSLVEGTIKAREALAAQTYDSVLVKAALSAEAAKGFASCVISTAEPVDLRATAAAKAIEAWLARERLQTSWSRRPDPARSYDLASGFWDLVITWDLSRDQA